MTETTEDVEDSSVGGTGHGTLTVGGQRVGGNALGGRATCKMDISDLFDLRSPALFPRVFLRFLRDFKDRVRGRSFAHASGPYECFKGYHQTYRTRPSCRCSYRKRNSSVD